MERSMVGFLIAVIAALVVLLAGVWSLEQERRAADREAQMHATIRLLSEFHTEYLRKKNLPLNDYEDEFNSFATSNPNFSYLKLYGRYVEDERNNVEQLEDERNTRTPD